MGKYDPKSDSYDKIPNQIRINRYLCPSCSMLVLMIMFYLLLYLSPWTMDSPRWNEFSKLISSSFWLRTHDCNYQRKECILCTLYNLHTVYCIQYTSQKVDNEWLQMDFQINWIKAKYWKRLFISKQSMKYEISSSLAFNSIVLCSLLFEIPLFRCTTFDQQLWHSAIFPWVISIGFAKSIYISWEIHFKNRIDPRLDGRKKSANAKTWHAPEQPKRNHFSKEKSRNIQIFRPSIKRIKSKCMPTWPYSISHIHSFIIQIYSFPSRLVYMMIWIWKAIESLIW